MDKLISDSEQVEISNKANHMIRALFIDACKSEPYKQFHNPS